jgi:flagellar hook-length control protein FliK
MIQRIPLNLIERLADPRSNRGASASGPDAAGDAASVQEAVTPGTESGDASALRPTDGARVRGPFADLMSRGGTKSAKTECAGPGGADRRGDERSEAAADAVAQAVAFAGPPPAIAVAMPSPTPVAAVDGGSADRSTMPEQTPGVEPRSLEGREGARQSSIPSAPFDLPTFLRVLPATGPEVAVAAAREPAMAEALQRLPRAAAMSVPQSSPAQMNLQPEGRAPLPEFLVQGAGANPGRSVTPGNAAAGSGVSAAPLAEGRSVASPVAMAAFIGERPAVSSEGRPRAGTVSRGEVSGRDRAGRPAVPPAELTGSSPTLRTTPDTLIGMLTAQQSPAGWFDRSFRTVDTRLTISAPPVPVSADTPSAPMAPLADLSTTDASGASALHQPVGTDAWQDELSAQLAVMAEQGERSEAVMKLAPEGLGELEIRVQVQGVEASLQFGAANAEARQALELAQSRLRELMADQGLKLSDLKVFSSLHGNSHSGSNNRGEHRSGEGAAVPSAEAVGELRTVVAPRRAAGVVDLYA